MKDLKETIKIINELLACIERREEELRYLDSLPSPRIEREKFLESRLRTIKISLKKHLNSIGL